MNKKRSGVRIISCLLVLMLTVGLFGQMVYADDEERTGSVTVRYLDGKDISDVPFKLYRVANYEEGAFKGAVPFDKYRLSWKRVDSSDWNSLASTLKNYISRDDIEARQSASTNREGECTFSGLEKGLYLVIGEKVERDNTIYTSAPFFVVMPREVDGELVYDMTVRPKGTTKDVEPDEPDDPDDPDEPGKEVEKIKRKVLKVWKNDDESERPSSIKVDLLKDGAVYETVELTAENNWRHTWDGLSKNHEWTVVETEVPEGYSMVSEKEGVTYVITNELEEDIEDENPPKGKDDDEEEEELDDDVPRGGGGDDDEEELDDLVPLGNLPDTGVLWWPVPVLFCGGLLLLGVGITKKNR